MTVCCVFSLESPNEYAQNTNDHIKKENHPKLYQTCNYGFCSNGLKNEFEIAVVDEPSVFEPLKFYVVCNLHLSQFNFISEIV